MKNPHKKPLKTPEIPIKIEPKSNQIFFSLDDLNYPYESLKDLTNYLKNENLLELGTTYYEAVFEDDKPSSYAPKDFAEILEAEFRDKYLGDNDLEQRIIYLKDEKKGREFNQKLKALIDEYFLCFNQNFISKTRKSLTQNDLDLYLNN